MNVPSLFLVCIVAVCIDCTLCRPSGKLPPSKKDRKPPVKAALEGLGYSPDAMKNMSKLEMSMLIGELASKYVVVTRFARRLACPTKIRHRQERFSIEHLDAAIAVKNLQGRIKTEVKNTHASILKMLTNAVRSLASVAMKPAYNRTMEFGPAWLRLRKCLPPCKDRTQTRADPSNTDDRTLKNVVIELAGANDVHEARELWNEMLSSKNEERNESFWETRHSYLCNADDEDLKFLAYENVIPKLENDEFFQNLSRRGKEFAKDFVLLEQHQNDKDDDLVETEKYGECSMVMYFSGDEEIVLLREKNFTEIFPGMRRYEQIKAYCRSFAQLYNEVSAVNKHTLEAEPPDDTCVPGSKDYEMYIEHFTKRHSLGFVARSLIAPYQDTLLLFESRKTYLPRY